MTDLHNDVITTVFGMVAILFSPNSVWPNIFSSLTQQLVQQVASAV